MQQIQDGRHLVVTLIPGQLHAKCAWKEKNIHFLNIFFKDELFLSKVPKRACKDIRRRREIGWNTPIQKEITAKVELEKERNYKYTCLKKKMARFKITEEDSTERS